MSGRASHDVVWFDDEIGKRRLKRLATGLRRRGLNVYPAADATKAQQLVREHEPDLLILDLRAEDDTRRFAQEVLAHRPWQRIQVYSGFLGAEEFTHFDRQISPSAPLKEAQKREDGQAEEERLFRSLMQLVDDEVPNIERLRSSVDESLKRQSNIPERDPFSVSSSELRTLSDDDFASLDDQAFELAEPFLDWIFENTSAHWVVLSGGPTQVLRWGQHRANQPDDKEMFNIAGSTGSMPYLFTAPVEVDDLDLAGISTGNPKWSGCGEAWYPSISLQFLKTAAPPIDFHFDTGCPQTFIDRELLDRLGVVEAWPRFGSNSKDVRSGTRFRSKQAEITALAASSDQSPKVRLVVDGVSQWEESPFVRRCQAGSCEGSLKDDDGLFVCSKRRGLVGRSIFVDNNGIQVLLDGSKRETSISFSEGET